MPAAFLGRRSTRVRWALARGRWELLAATFGVFLLAGCAPLLRTPSGFVSLDEERGHYDYRAVNPDGLVIAARSLDHEPQGDLAFWTRAIEGELRGRGGYALLDSREVRTGTGLVGKQLRFGLDQGSEPHLYYVTIFVTDARIYLLEAGGKKQLVQKHEATIATSIRSLTAD